MKSYFSGLDRFLWNSQSEILQHLEQWKKNFNFRPYLRGTLS